MSEPIRMPRTIVLDQQVDMADRGQLLAMRKAALSRIQQAKNEYNIINLALLSLKLGRQP